MPIEPRIAPEDLSCPVCDRITPAPAPQTCPHCDAPIKTILELLRTADLSISEALRDLRIGDLKSAARRLSFVRATSKRHRLRVEVIQAVIDRLKGEPASALARVRAVEEQLDEVDELLLYMIDSTIRQCVLDQESLATCCEYYNFALFQAVRGHFEEARHSLEKALNEVPHHAESHALMGKVQVALQEEDDARYHFRRALATDPSNTAATRMLARMGRSRIFNPVEYIATRFSLSPGIAGSVIVVVIILVMVLAAMFG